MFNFNFEQSQSTRKLYSKNLPPLSRNLGLKQLQSCPVLLENMPVEKPSSKLKLKVHKIIQKPIFQQNRVVCLEILPKLKIKV